MVHTNIPSFVLCDFLENNSKTQWQRRFQHNLETYHHLQLQLVQAVVIAINSTISLTRIYNTWASGEYCLARQDPMPAKQQ